MTARTLALAALLTLALPAAAATLVNINTANSATLQTLSGIGPTKAQAIIDYRTQNGPFATTADIMNVSGIGTATYNSIKDFITVSDSSASSQSTEQTQTTTSSTTTTTQVVQSGNGLALPQVSARIVSDAEAIVGAGTVFEGHAFDASGKPLMGVRYVWNFGDGTTGEGAYAVHTYHYPGTYEVWLSIAYGYSSATARLAVPAITAEVTLVAEGDGSLTIENHADVDLDVGFWSLRQGTSTFVLPESTVLLRNMGIRFAPEVLGFSGGTSAQLYYPNGSAASRAYVGSASPLRGQVVSLSSTKSVASGYADSTAVKSAEVLAPSRSQPPSATISSPSLGGAAANADTEGLWPYLLGLTGIIALGVVGTYYAHVPRREPETEVSPEEFEIE